MAIIDDGGSGCNFGGFIDGVVSSDSGFVTDNGGGADDDIGGGFVGVMMMIFQIKQKI
jgi:hypothetical protein